MLPVTAGSLSGAFARYAIYLVEKEGSSKSKNDKWPGSRCSLHQWDILTALRDLSTPGAKEERKIDHCPARHVAEGSSRHQTVKEKGVFDLDDQALEAKQSLLARDHAAGEAGVDVF